MCHNLPGLHSTAGHPHLNPRSVDCKTSALPVHHRATRLVSIRWKTYYTISLFASVYSTSSSSSEYSITLAAFCMELIGSAGGMLDVAWPAWSVGELSPTESQLAAFSSTTDSSSVRWILPQRNNRPWRYTTVGMHEHIFILTYASVVWFIYFAVFSTVIMNYAQTSKGLPTEFSQTAELGVLQAERQSTVSKHWMKIISISNINNTLSPS